MAKKKKLPEEMLYTYCWTLGDWSNDGHGKYTQVNFKTNLEIKKIRKAYLASCEKLGWSFHGHDPKSLCSEYDDCKLPTEFLKLIHDKGFDLRELLDCEEVLEGYTDPNSYEFTGKEEYFASSSDLIKLLMWYVSLEYPDFKYECIDTTNVSVNGYWDKTLNCQIGYGLYY